MPRGIRFNQDVEDRIKQSIAQGGSKTQMALRAGVSMSAIRHRLSPPASSNGAGTHTGIARHITTLIPKQYARIAKAIRKGKKPEVIARRVGCAVSTVERCVAFTRGTGQAAKDFIEAWGKLTRNGTRRSSVVLPAALPLSHRHGTDSNKLVLKLLRKQPQLTYKEIERRTGVPYQTVYARAISLGLRQRRNASNNQIVLHQRKGEVIHARSYSEGHALPVQETATLFAAGYVKSRIDSFAESGNIPASVLTRGICDILYDSAGGQEVRSPMPMPHMRR